MLFAASIGVQHASLGQKAFTGKQLFSVVSRYIAPNGGLGYRNGHTFLLKRAYGAGYGGIKLSRDGQRRAAKAVERGAL